MKNKLEKELLAKETREKLERFVGQRVEDDKDAEEIVQETLLSAWKCLPVFRGKAKLFSWVCGIAKHEISDFYRKKKIKQVVFSRLPFLRELVSQALGPELQYQELEAKRRILRTLKSLSEGYRRVLRLKYIDGLSMKEIAEKEKISLKAVESRLTRARLAFRKVYAKNNQNWLVVGD